MHCIITNCYNGSGSIDGAIANNGTLAMQQCLFVKSGGVGGAASGVRGGCIYNSSGCYVTLNSCIMTNCAADQGVGLENHGTAFLSNC